MHVGRNRIFVGNLPPLVNENDIKQQFGNYGNVVSVEIKHRKENANINENVSPVFAFVTIETDKNQLHECFQSIANYNWDGYYVKLEIAKESFLERLKREREEAQLNKTPTNINNEEQNNLPSCSNVNTNININKPSTSKKALSSDDSSESSSSSESEAEAESDSDESSSDAPPKKDTNGVIDDLVIKNNKNKHLTNGKITIESVSSPIHVHTPKFGKLQKDGEKLTPADEKRLNSLYKLKESQNQQKSLIKNALSQIDTGNKSNKIIFDDEGQSTSNNKPKQNVNSIDSNKDKVALFEEDDDDDTINFQIKDQFEGKKGQRLLELQSRYTNDKRFTLDSRFAEDEDNDEEVNDKVEDDEKQKQMEILENVIGRKLNKAPQQDVNKKNNTPRGMLRYDPTNAEHSKFEIKDKIVNNDDDESTSEGENENENEQVEEAPVEVSKEKFYKVTDNLKQAFKETEGFSLLSMFGTSNVEEKKEPEKHETTAITKSINNERNPFRYDSSDSEDEDAPRRKHQKTDVTQIKPVFNRPLLSGEKFFFQNEDARLKDGLNFLKKFGVGTENTEKFAETRQQIKEILRLKLRNVQRNNRPFQTKIGQNQHQQHKRIKIKNANKN